MNKIFLLSCLCLIASAQEAASPRNETSIAVECLKLAGTVAAFMGVFIFGKKIRQIRQNKVNRPRMKAILFGK